MRNKKKLAFSQIKIKSFVTSLGKANTLTFKGGGMGGDNDNPTGGNIFCSSKDTGKKGDLG